MTGSSSILSTTRWTSTPRCRSRLPRSAPASRRWRGCRRGSCGWRRGFSTAAGSASSCRMSIPRRRRSISRRPCATRRAATARSLAALPHFGYAKLGMAETVASIDAATLVIVLLETPTAIANADAIAAVPGIELAADRHPTIWRWSSASQAALPTSASSPPTRPYATPAVRTASSPGPVSSPTRTLLRRYIGMGARLILPGSDLTMMVRAATETATAMRACL